MEKRSRHHPLAIHLLLAALLALPIAPLAAPATGLAISQGIVSGTDILLYAAVRDEAGEPVTGLATDVFSATVGREAAVVETVTEGGADEGVGYILLVDVSRSLTNRQFGPIRQALTAWVERMTPNDRAALIEFGDGVRTLVDFTADQAALQAAITELGPTDDFTFLHQALVRGMTLGRQAVDGVPRRRAVIVLTDGLDDVAGGVTAEEVFEAMTEDPVPIHAIGFSKPGRNNEAGFKALGRFARASGGTFVDGTRQPLTDAYEQIGMAVNEVYHVALRCAACIADGGRYRVQLVLHSAGASLRDAIELRLYPATEDTAPEAPAVEAPAQDTDEPVEPAADTAPAESGAVPEPPETAPEVSPAPEAASESLAQSGEQPATVSPASWWQRPEVLGGGAGLLLLLLLLVLWRRRSKNSATELEPDEMPEVQQETATEEPAVPSPTKAESTPVPTAPPRSIGLTALDGGAYRDFSLSAPLTIGRDEANRWPLPGDDTVSSDHAQILERRGVIVLEDLGSTNGTFLNGVRVKTANPLHDDDLIRIGELELRVVLQEGQ